MDLPSLFLYPRLSQNGRFFIVIFGLDKPPRGGLRIASRWLYTSIQSQFFAREAALLRSDPQYLLALDWHTPYLALNYEYTALPVWIVNTLNVI